MTALEEAFFDFHVTNPHVYALFCKYTQEMIHRGHRRYSARDVFARMRWHLDENDQGKLKLPNNHSPYYARLWMKNHPQFQKFFEKHTVEGGSRVRVKLVDLEVQVHHQTEKAW